MAPARVSRLELGALLFPGARTVGEAEDAAREGSSPTARNLWACLTRLMDRTGTPDDALGLYRRPERVIAWLEGSEAPPAAASKLSFYSALATLSNPDKAPSVARHVPGRARRRFAAQAAVHGREVRAQQASNRLDARERAVIMRWPDIVACYRKRRHLLNDSQAVIAALYLAGGDNPAGAPRRLDYNAVRVFHGKAPPVAPPDLNYITVRSPTNVDLVLQEFKTRRYYGPYNVTLPAAVSRVIHASLARSPREWLVHDAQGRPLTPSSFGKRVAATMRRLTGRAIGASNLRKSFITWLYSRDDIPRHRMDQYAKAMNHSPAEQKLYCRKNIRPVYPD